MELYLLKEFCGKEYKNNGIYIDIFPLDYVKNKDSIVFKIKYKIIRFLMHILRFRNCKIYYKEIESRYKYIIDYIISLPFIIFSNKLILKILKLIMTSNGNEKNAKYYAMFEGTSKKGYILKKDIYIPCKKLKFENNEYNVPGKIEEYLRMNYGEDYMKLPPEDKRHTHEPLQVKFL